MFTTNYNKLRSKTRETDYNRCDFLQALLNEYQDCGDNEDARLQVLANLANFSYDPINYQRMRELKIPEMFVDCIEMDESLNGNRANFGVAGLCNLLADPANREVILYHPRAVSLLVRCLSSDRDDTIMSALTCLSQLINMDTKLRIVTSELRMLIQRFGSSANARLKTLARAISKIHHLEIKFDETKFDETKFHEDNFDEIKFD